MKFCVGILYSYTSLFMKSLMSKVKYNSLKDGRLSCELIGWSRYALWIGMLKFLYMSDPESTLYVVDAYDEGKERNITMIPITSIYSHFYLAYK